MQVYGAGRPVAWTVQALLTPKPSTLEPSTSSDPQVLNPRILLPLRFQLGAGVRRWWKGGVSGWTTFDERVVLLLLLLYYSPA